MKGEIRCRRCMFRILQIEPIRQQVYRCPLHIQKTSITPFQKVLEKENALYAAASEENTESASLKRRQQRRQKKHRQHQRQTKRRMICSPRVQEARR